MATSHAVALGPECDALRAEFQALSTDADALVASLDDVQFTWRPSPHAWSVAECLDHLNAAARAYLPSLDDGISTAIRRGLYAPGPYRYNWIGRLMAYIVGPSSRVRAKAPRLFLPAPDRRRSEIMAAFRAYQVQYIDRLRQASGLDLARARVMSPASRWIRIPLGSAFEMTLAHERRHLAQARRVLDTPGFPRQGPQSEVGLLGR